MSSSISIYSRFAIILFISVLFISGCSDSSHSQSPAEAELTNKNEAGEIADDGADGNDAGSSDSSTGETESAAEDSGPSVQVSTRVSFNITVPAYVSDALQVRLVWGDKNIAGRWVSDEFWTASDDFPVNTRHPLIVTFYGGNEVWRQQAYVKASNTDPGDSFGRKISLSADGNTLAVGASNEYSATTGINGNQNDNSIYASGAVYLFVRVAENWQQQAYLKASNTDQGDSFGGAVSLSADGNTLAVGAIGEGGSGTGLNSNQNDNSAGSSGAVYVFVRRNADWQQQSYLKSSNSDAGDQFGQAVSLNSHGDTLAIGAPVEGGGATGINGNQDDNSALRSGAVYL